MKTLKLLNIALIVIMIGVGVIALHDNNNLAFLLAFCFIGMCGVNIGLLVKEEIKTKGVEND